ncbi:uncharacterized protein LOC142317596 [Lycorma delicatula]|uniref:uncharacterized protein LOC142317596 n=1 Tax=Lycorma delicatula TaxID=130591 RepID=UPI003F516B80
MGKSENLFRYMKSALNDSGRVCPLKGDNQTIVDGSELCEEFGKYFQSVYKPCEHDVWKIDFGILDNFIVDVPVVIVEKVELCIKSLRPRSAADFDGVLLLSIKTTLILLLQFYPRFIILACSPEFSRPVGSVPPFLPVPKKGDHCVDNYHPISVINDVAKLFEKMVYRHLYTTLGKMVPPYQHGFREGKSTMTNLNMPMLRS